MRACPPDRNKSIRTQDPLSPTHCHFVASGRDRRKLAAAAGILASYPQREQTGPTQRPGAGSGQERQAGVMTPARYGFRRFLEVCKEGAEDAKCSAILGIFGESRGNCGLFGLL